MGIGEKQILFAILALAFLVRIVGLDYGLPLTVVGDEPPFVIGALTMMQEKTLIPGLHPEAFLDKVYFPPYFIYILLIPLALVMGIWYLLAGVSFEIFQNLVALDPTPLYLTVRFIVAVLGTLTVWIVYKAARNIFQEAKPALLSALVLALALLHVNFSHWGRHWIPITLVFATVIWLLTHPNLSIKKRYLLSTLAVGIGFGINYQAIVIAPFIILYFLLVDKISLREALKTRWVWGSMFLFLILLAIPIALYPQNLQVISPENVTIYRGEEPTGVFGFFWSYWFYLRHMLFSEPVFILAAISGLLILLRNLFTRRLAATFALYSLVYVAIFYLVFHLQGRYILLLYPIFALSAGYAMSKIRSKILVGAILLLMLVPVLRFDQLLVRNDTRIQVRDWVSERLQVSEKIAYLARLARLPSTPVAIAELESIESSALRKVDLAERDLPQEFLPEPRHHTLNLANVEDEAFFLGLREYLEENDYKYFILSPELVGRQRINPKFHGETVEHFEGSVACDDDNDMTNGFGGGLPALFGLPNFGPALDVIKLY